MKKILKQIIKNAKQTEGIILLPEANIDERVKHACELILKHEMGKIAVLGKQEEFDDSFKSPNCLIFNPDDEKLKQELAKKLVAVRRRKGMTLEQASELIKQPNYFSMMLLKSGMVDGVVAGAKWTTKDVLKPALQIIKTLPKKSICVGTMLMVKEDEESKLFSDISLNLNPSSIQLAEIAISSAEFMEKVLKQKPRVAMLSYSTNGSGAGEMVDKVREATEIAQTKCEYNIEGEMQADVALDPETAKLKKCAMY